MNKNVIVVIVLICVGAAAVALALAILFARVRRRGGSTIVLPAPPAGDATRAEAAARYLCSSRRLFEAKAKKAYGALFDSITPAIQQLLGYARYDMPRESEDEARETVNFLLGANFDNAARGAGFVLEGDRFAPLAARGDVDIPLEDAPAEWSAEELSLGADKLDANAEVLLKVYSRCERFCKLAAPALTALRAPSSSALSEDIAALENAYARSPLALIYYETAPESLRGTFQFADSQCGYPAVTSGGKLFREHAGKRPLK